MPQSFSGIALALLASACTGANPAMTASNASSSPDRQQLPAVGRSGPTLVVQVEKTPGREHPVRAGDVVDVCVAPGLRLRQARVEAIMCKVASNVCNALVSFDAQSSTFVLHAYDPENPPVIAVDGKACPAAG
jgi:hypothetical protein